ncbi:MAG: hypothetical protein MZW92_09505 [Comamonadaceae bacterium]|nr:hypothetical protein [Comamonadaceae bacterium]
MLPFLTDRRRRDGGLVLVHPAARSISTSVRARTSRRWRSACARMQLASGRPLTAAARRTWTRTQREFEARMSAGGRPRGRCGRGARAARCWRARPLARLRSFAIETGDRTSPAAQGRAGVAARASAAGRHRRLRPAPGALSVRR